LNQWDYLTSGGMGIPKDITHAAWFNLGPRPGEKGNAVIDGHYGWKNNIPAVFDSLSQLQKGDKIFVDDEKGVVQHL
jgi:sortase (surface protein transpeptidase)